jgi:hypothetical protein
VAGKEKRDGREGEEKEKGKGVWSHGSKTREKEKDG